MYDRISNADFDDTNGFRKFIDLDQNNPTTKFATFWAIISVYAHAYGPKFVLTDSFLTLEIWTKTFLKIRKFYKKSE